MKQNKTKKNIITGWHTYFTGKGHNECVYAFSWHVLHGHCAWGQNAGEVHDEVQNATHREWCFA